MKTAAWQAIIFDFDGVVVESGEIKTQAFGDLYRTYGETVMTAVMQYHSLQTGACRAITNFVIFSNILLKKPPLTPDEEQYWISVSPNWWSRP